MAQILGRAWVKNNGVTYNSTATATLKTGGFQREPITNYSGKVFFTEKPTQAEVTCEIIMESGVDPVEIQNMTDATITFEGNNGSMYVVSNAFVSEPAEISSENGTYSVTFIGNPAEKV